MYSVIIITGVMCVCLIGAILIKPNITIGKISLGTYWMVALCGAAILLCKGCISVKQVGEGLVADSAINPVKILVLFLSMTVQSIFLDEVGMFKYCANFALRKSGHSQKKLFISLYAVVSLLTVFTSNDIIILTFTPFICYFAKNAGINPIPYLFTEFVAANTWSMALVIGNPTNVYLASFDGITFMKYARTMALPALLGGVCALGMLYLIFRKNLAKDYEGCTDSVTIENKPLLIIGLCHLGLCTLLLVLSSYIGFSMWLVTMVFAISLFACVTVYSLATGRREGLRLLFNSFKRMPWELVPFVISMFVCVLAFKEAGLSGKVCEMLGTDMTVIKYGLASFVTANLINNIPMSVLFASIAEGLSGVAHTMAVYAAIIGSNVGAFFTPIGALAGIMWTGILKKHDVKFGFGTYIKYGILIALPTLAAALLGLWIVSCFN